MPKFAHYDPVSGDVLNVMDTDAFNYAEMPAPEMLLPLSDKQYESAMATRKVIKSGKLYDYVEPKPIESAPVDPRASVEVTAFQARAALARSGKLDTVTAIMANEATPLETKLAWEYAQTFKRLSPTISQLKPALGLSDQDLDDLFALAATIDA